jgi:2-oxoglutarate dehydrogenase E2 component (dihydrolipoamide succinyltransferase)
LHGDPGDAGRDGMSAVDVVLARETANDEVGTVVAIHAPSGTQVVQGQLLFEIENSKVTQELEAPATGRIVHGLQIGQTVDFGVTIAQVIGGEDDAVAALAAAAAPPPAAAPAPIQPAPPPAAPPAAFRYISETAAALIAEHRIEEDRLPGGFVTVREVRALLGLPSPATVPTPGVAVGPRQVSVQPVGEPVGTRKAAEIDVLGRGAGGTLLSVLGVAVGEIQVERQHGDFLDGRITDLVIFEASRLMRKYPLLNAFYEDGRIVRHTDVHAGIAIDDGGRLMVYGIEHSDRAGLAALADRISEAVERYIGNSLTLPELTRATFTVTDLSANELDFVLPLLPAGQSCILGVTHSAGSGFRIFAGFDHRVTEGREVALFLGELRDRLRSFASPPSPSAAACSFCGQSLGDTVAKARVPGLLQVIGRGGAPALCCVSCWNGW